MSERETVTEIDRMVGRVTGEVDILVGIARRHERAAAELRECLEIAMRQLVQQTGNRCWGATEAEQRDRIRRALGPDAWSRVVDGVTTQPPTASGRKG